MSAGQWFAGIAAFCIALLLAAPGRLLPWLRPGASPRLRARLRQAAGLVDAPVSIRRQRPLAHAPLLQRLLARCNWSAAFERLLAQAGLRIRLAPFLLASLFLCGLPLLWALRRRARRLAQVEAALPDALDLMGRALRAGHALPAALRIAAEESAGPAGPLSAELRMLVDEVDFGMPMADALRALSSRLPCPDIACLIAALSVQRETGGNLPELMEVIAGLVRDRERLRDSIRVCSAEGRLSAWILGLLPLALAAVLQLAHPEFLRLLWTEEAGRRMLGGAALLLVFGVFWMRALVRIRI
jgi:tight adherence protein B